MNEALTLNRTRTTFRTSRVAHRLPWHSLSVVSLNVTGPRSESIDQYVLPELRAEALQAQSASIDGVSGASYTSAAYEQSMQSAIDKLKA